MTRRCPLDGGELRDPWPGSSEPVVCKTCGAQVSRRGPIKIVNRDAPIERAVPTDPRRQTR